MRAGFSVPVTLREAAANLRSVPARTAAVITVALTIGAGTVAATAADTAYIESEWAKQVAAGSTTWTIKSGNNTPLPTPRCDALNTVTGVHTSGAIMAATNIYPTTAPGTRVTLLTVTPGYIAAAFPEANPHTTVFAGVDAATRLGLVDNATLAYRTGSSNTPATAITIGQAATARGRIDGINDSILVAAAAAGTSDECLTSADPGAWETSAPVLQHWFPATDQPIAIPLVLPNNLVTDPNTALRNRAGRWAGIAAGAAILVMLTAVWLARRSEYALYRMLGLTRRRLIWMLSLDTLILAALPLQITAALVALAYSGHSGPVIAAILSTSTQALMLTVLAPLLGALLLGRLDVLDSLKGK